MQWFEIIIIIAVIAFVGLVTFFHFYNKKKGKGSCSDCGGNCSACSGNCHKNCQKILEEYHKAKEL